MNYPEQNRDPQLITDGKRIGFYEREFYPFSNFSSFQIEWNKEIWPTSEHAYQASHFIDTAPELYHQIKQCKSAHEAFKLAKENADKAPENWNDIKISVMEEIVRLKLQQHEYVRRKLLQTGDLELIEDSPYDDFWGWGPNKDGRNELGKIWMKLRDELKQK